MATTTDQHATLGLEGGQRLFSLPADDKQTATSLCESCPQLHHDFRNILGFLDLMDRDEVQDCEGLFDSLSQIEKVFRYRFAEVNLISRFATAAGFVEKAVEVLRRLVKESGEVYVTSLPKKVTDHRTGCLSLVTNMLLNFTDKEMTFRLRLARTGLLGDMVEGLRAIRDRSDEELNDGRICFRSIGTIHNCCKHLEVMQLVKQMDIVQHISPFVHKRSLGIRVPALLLLGQLVEDKDLQVLELDHDMLQFCLCRAQAAWDSGNRGKNGWETEELLVGLSSCARLPFNRRLIAAKGVTELLTSVLQSQVDGERAAAAATLAELAKDPANSRLLKRDGRLREALSRLQQSGDQQGRLDVLWTLVRAPDSEDVDVCCPTLSDLLAEEMNTLTILGTGQVQFVLEKLSSLTSGGESTPEVMSRGHLLRALREQAQGDDSYRREILARGGLRLLHDVLKTDEENDDNVRLESARLLLLLTSHKEYCLLLKAQAELMATLGRLKEEDKEQMAVTCGQVNDAIISSTT